MEAGTEGMTGKKMENYRYRVSMIIPIYNMEKFLRECLDSVAAQTIDPSSMEVLLVDDGSMDGSPAIMEEYVQKYPNMKPFTKQNEGLSMTRNFGIKKAQGKYIMYLDADDTLSPETVESVVDFFDRHYEQIDLVGYPEVPVIEGEFGEEHFRYRYLKASGVYDLTKDENIFITQTRINICVKNMGEENVLFSSDRTFRHEDQKYCTEVLIKKMRYGFCKKGLYLYRHQPDSIVRTYFYAYYIFESTMRFWEELFGRYEYGKVPRYIQALYMNDVNWKTRGNVLLPYHYSPEKLEEAKGRVIRLLDQVEDYVIASHPKMDPFHVLYFVSQKTNTDIKKYEGYHALTLTDHDFVVEQTTRVTLTVHNVRIDQGRMHFTGCFKSKATTFLGRPKVYMVLNENMLKKRELKIVPSSWDYYHCKTRTNSFWTFTVDIDLEKVKSISFCGEIDGNIYPTNFYFMSNTLFSIYKKTTYLKDGRRFWIEGDKICVAKAREGEIEERKKSIRRKYRKDYAARIARTICTMDLKRFNNVWLYYDCKGIRMDNGYFQFIHDFEKQDGVQRYYVVNEDNFEEIRGSYPKKYRKHIVHFGGRFHKFLYLKAKKILTAFIEKPNYFPFTPQLFKKYADVFSFPEIIYLQHGVLHAHVPWKYSLDRLGIDRMVISTEYERQNLIDHYCYSESALIASGMPRYDFFETEEQSVNRILFAPSWRKYLISLTREGWVGTEDKFRRSVFFEETQRLLNSRELEELLERYDFYLDFKLHPIFERYKHLYHITNSRVSMAESRIKETQYSIFMTDFSSFLFDFVYLQKPIIYFMPDYDMFRAGMHDYRELDIPLEDGFGELTTAAGEAVSALERLLKNGCRPEERYAAKMRDFFLYKDHGQRDRLYEALTDR